MPGYIFLHIDIAYDRWQQLYGAPGFISYLGSPTPINDFDILDLDRLLPRSVRPRDPGLKFQVGDNVRILSGVFDGFTGKIVEVRSKYILIVTWLFGRPTETLVAIEHIEKIDAASS